jgi:hypothetical protein
MLTIKWVKDKPTNYTESWHARIDKQSLGLRVFKPSYYVRWEICRIEDDDSWSLLMMCTGDGIIECKNKCLAAANQLIQWANSRTA